MTRAALAACVCVLACVAGGLAAGVPQLSEHAISDQSAAAYSLAAVQVARGPACALYRACLAPPAADGPHAAAGEPRAGLQGLPVSARQGVRAAQVCGAPRCLPR